MLVFLSVIKNIVVLCPCVFVVFAQALVAFTQNSKEPSNRDNAEIHPEARSLHENLARSAAYQSARTTVAI